MERLDFRDGLLYTSVLLTINDKSVKINYVIVDTGASHTILLTDYLDELCIYSKKSV